MKELNKTARNKLRINYNVVVKKEFRISPDDQSKFDDWFIHNCEVGEDLGVTYEGAPFFTYAEISKFKTISGNPYILEVL
tara:strand:- start:1289 stop:1528 length:240 start_codon:yes stop_codon:yes gene_type:complete